MSAKQLEDIKKSIGTVMDFPSKGICFRDISGLLRVPHLRELTLDLMAQHYVNNKIKVDVIAGIDSRGFIFGMGIAARLNIPFIMVRKPNKLPGETVSVDYGLEYGKNSLNLQVGSVKAGDKVVVVDDLLATGGSAQAACSLVTKLGATVVGTCFCIELDGLNGKEKLPNMDVFSLLHFPADGDAPAPEGKEKAAEKPATKVPEIKEKAAEPAEKTPVVTPEHSPRKALVEEKKITRANTAHFQDDPRAIVLYHPTMASIAENICTAFPGQFRKGLVSWEFFPDGWPNIKFEHMSALEGKHVVFIGSLYDIKHIIEQLSLVMVLPRQFVESLSIVFPYFAPATMERVDEEGILATAETLAKLVSAAIPLTRTGPASLRIFDIHALPVRFYFTDSLMMRLMSGIPLLLEEIAQNHPDITLCFPDDGAAKRFKPMFDKMPMIVCAKVREGDKRIIRITDQLNFESEHRPLDHVLIIDDLVQSGGTLDECRKALIGYGAKKVSAYVTHAVFPNNGYQRFLEGGDRHGFENFFITNTIPVVAAQVEGKKPFVVLKVDNIIAKDIIKLQKLNRL